MPHFLNDNIDCLPALIENLWNEENIKVTSFSEPVKKTFSYLVDSLNGTPIGKVIFSNEFLDDIPNEQMKNFIKQNFQTIRLPQEQFFKTIEGQPTVEIR